MNWFDEQIKERIKNDDQCFAEGLANMSSVVMGKSILNALLQRTGEPMMPFPKFFPGTRLNGGN